MLLIIAPHAAYDDLGLLLLQRLPPEHCQRVGQLPWLRAACELLLRPRTVLQYDALRLRTCMLRLPMYRCISTRYFFMFDCKAFHVRQSLEQALSIFACLVYLAQLGHRLVQHFEVHLLIDYAVPFNEL